MNHAASNNIKRPLIIDLGAQSLTKPNALRAANHLFLVKSVPTSVVLYSRHVALFRLSTDTCQSR